MAPLRIHLAALFTCCALQGLQSFAQGPEQTLQVHLSFAKLQAQKSQYFDVQAHRGGRGNTVESTLPAFAWALIDGATTLELDNGITKDGAVVVWHDEQIKPEKCQDTKATYPGDPDYPYVGKFISQLTLAQIQTLDCGSRRQLNYPMQLLFPGARIPTLSQVFDFVSCADPAYKMLWNIESKINPVDQNQTLEVFDFVLGQHAVFMTSPYRHSITYQSFDWRTLIAMKSVDPSISTSALIDDETTTMPDNSTSPWLAGLRLDAFQGPSAEEQIAQAASAVGADILSPAASVLRTKGGDMIGDSYIPFTTEAMVREAHRLGMSVKPWTVNNLGILEDITALGVDGIITDYPNVVRRWAKNHGLRVAPKYPKQRVLSCLERHTSTSRPS